MTPFKTLRARFIDRPSPDAVFSLSVGRLCGIRVSASGRAVRKRCILPFEREALAPSFDRPNAPAAAYIGPVIHDAKKRLGLGGGTVSLLIPEPCVRLFILSAESVPAAQAERENFVRWRIGKLMPLLPDDLRLDYAVSAGAGPKKIIAIAARDAVIREYEGLFEEAGLKVGTVTIPSLSLVNLLDGGTDESALILNIESDGLSFLAVMDGGWALYRQKALGTDLPAEERISLVVQEVENTVHFLEDKERKRAAKIRVRSELWEEGPLVVSRLKDVLALPAEMIVAASPEDWNAGERAMLAPLVGQVS
ncbi:MAG: hypothetical protein ABFD80_11285 [Acidobacteriota bacterium]